MAHAHLQTLREVPARAGISALLGVSPLEAILIGNKNCLTIAPNGLYNRLLLEREGGREFKSIPPEFRKLAQWHTGTAFLFEKKDKPFGASLEKPFYFEGQLKTIIYRFDREQIGVANVMLMCDHGFAGDTNFLDLLDANGRQIFDIRETDEITLKFNGPIRQFEMKTREHSRFEVFENISTDFWFLFGKEDWANVGLLGRGYDTCYPTLCSFRDDVSCLGAGNPMPSGIG